MDSEVALDWYEMMNITMVLMILLMNKIFSCLSTSRIQTPETDVYWEPGDIGGEHLQQ